MEPTKRQLVIALAHGHGAIRSQDVHRFGLARTYLQRLQREGVLVRVARGTYRLADLPVTEDATLVHVARRVPQGVICLLSALRFHGLGTQVPDEVWMAIDRKAWKPRVPELPIRFVRFSGPALDEGIERHQAQGVWFGVYSAAKSVADCFKYRHKIGLHVALEALRECRARRACPVQELWHYAGINRVQRVMKPYVEALG